MLTKEIIPGSIEIFEDARMQVREDTVVFEDGVEISRTFHRYVLNPGDEVATKPYPIPQLAALLWTPQVITDWLTKHIFVPPSNV